MRTKLLFAFLFCISLARVASANDIEPGKEFYSATRLVNPVVIDGSLTEWAGVPVLADPKFATPKGTGTNGTYVLFEQYNGGTWSGPDDQTSAVQVAYDDENVYFGFVVTDDSHENAANSAWNGDSVQLMIANADRDLQIALYNYALGGVEGSLGEVIVNHEAGPGGTEAVVKRDSATKKTIYEIKLPASSLDLAPPLTAGTMFGLGMAINDGDNSAGQEGQRGWGGLGAHSIVFGKTPAETALITLSTNRPGTDRFFFSAINQTSTSFTFRATDKAASIVDPASAQLTIDNQPAPLTFKKSGDATDFTHVNPTKWPSGSEHSYSISVKDTQGSTVTTQGTFKLPVPVLSAENLPSPNVVSNAWSIRYVFGGDTIADLTTALNQIKGVGTAGFGGVSVDTTNSVINFGTGGFFGNGQAYPDQVINHTSGLWSGDNFAFLAVGNIQITSESDYTFGVHTDDGFLLRIRGGEVRSLSGVGQVDPADPETIFFVGTTGDSNTRAVYHLKAGVYRVEFVWFDSTGAESGELYAAKGAFVADGDTDQWRLVGDSAPAQEFVKLGVDQAGWTVISSDPGGDPVSNWSDALAELTASGGSPKNYDSLYVGDPESNLGVQAFPKNTDGVADDDYVLKATATLVVPVDGTYLIGFNSDDGAYVKIAGKTFTEIVANATGLSVIQDNDTVICDCLTGDSGTTAKITLTKGNYPIEAGMFDRDGGSYLTVKGAQDGVPQLPVLAKNGSGTLRTADPIRLTDAAPGTGGGSDGPTLTLTRSGNNLTIQWTGAGTLESTPTLTNPTWTAIGTTNPATVTIGAANAFYRVRQ